MPGLDGVAATGRILGAAPHIRVVVLTAFSDRDRIVHAIEAGAVGYLLKDGEPEDVVRGIRAAAAGESPLAPPAARAVVAAVRDGAATQAQPPRLSAREREVLDLVRLGLANKQIALRLGIAEKTVKAHLTHVFEQIGVTDRTQAALWAERTYARRSE
jgi:DNA-binding NarL/FixJ family response regulator